jgi:hypothetical protein
VRLKAVHLVSVEYVYHGLFITLHELKGQDEPGPGDEGDVEEPEHVAQQTGGQDLESKLNSKSNRIQIAEFYLSN